MSPSPTRKLFLSGVISLIVVLIFLNRLILEVLTVKNGISVIATIQEVPLACTKKNTMTIVYNNKNYKLFFDKDECYVEKYKKGNFIKIKYFAKLNTVYFDKTYAKNNINALVVLYIIFYIASYIYLWNRGM